MQCKGLVVFNGCILDLGSISVHNVRLQVIRDMDTGSVWVSFVSIGK